MPVEADPQAIIAAIREELDNGVESLLSAAERALQAVGELRGGDAGALERLDEAISGLFGACAFHDLVGQRLSRLTELVTLAPAGDPLLNGPALPGAGLDQNAADALFGPPPASPAP